MICNDINFNSCNDLLLSVRSRQGPLQASIDERSEELAELVGMLARALRMNLMTLVVVSQTDIILLNAQHGW